MIYFIINITTYSNMYIILIPLGIKHIFMNRIFILKAKFSSTIFINIIIIFFLINDIDMSIISMCYWLGNIRAIIIA